VYFSVCECGAINADEDGLFWICLYFVVRLSGSTLLNMAFAGKARLRPRTNITASSLGAGWCEMCIAMVADGYACQQHIKKSRGTTRKLNTIIAALLV